ncbi:MAG: pseudaminic acid synthase [Magnetococcales bacterium]|nr:pseudaminic acid synthase [Magnetococcales bacterium]
MDEIILGTRKIGPDAPPFVIAEMSGNHNGDLQRALDLLTAAKSAGADAVKLQTYTPETITLDHDRPEFYLRGGLWDGMSLHQLYQKAYTPWEWHRALFERGRELGLMVFSTPFDFTAIDLLEELGNPIYKIASFEAVDLPLIRRAAATGKPMILSTGMATLAEIEESVQAAREGGCSQLALLHCISGYPTPIEDANLRTIPDLARRFGVAVGLSDHTTGTAAAVASIALGGSLIEKHFTLRRADGGPDAAFSLEPEELATLCRDCHAAWRSLGRAGYELKPSERALTQYRRSLYVVADLAAGELFTTENVRSIRPALGLAPKHYEAVLGRRAAREVRRGEPLAWEMVAP